MEGHEAIEDNRHRAMGEFCFYFTVWKLRHFVSIKFLREIDLCEFFGLTKP